MRITDFIRQQTALQGVRTNLDAVSRAQQELSSGRKVTTMSDDPVGSRQILHMDGQLRDIEQFRRNGVTASTRLATEDAVLTNLRGIVGTAKDLTVSAATQLPGDPLRLAAVATVSQLRVSVLALGNTRIGTEYIFAGGQTTTTPFPATGIYQGDTTVRQTQIAEGTTLAGNHTGDQIIAPTIQALDALTVALQTGTSAQVQAAGVALDAAQTGALVAQAETGSRQRQLIDVSAYLGRMAGVLQDRRGEIRDADPAESSIRLVTAQSALERAYAAIARVISTSLLDYLR
ncbi:MAG: flagellar hook-associated protein FlgL [Gemmatimonadota bacterium]